MLKSHFKYWAAFSVLAIILTVKRCIEQWVLWLAVDAIEMFMWWHTGADSMAILAMWTLFFVDGCYCFALWLRRGVGEARLQVQWDDAFVIQA